jgi:hypothetical protein
MLNRFQSDGYIVWDIAIYAIKYTQILKNLNIEDKKIGFREIENIIAQKPL